MLVFCLKNIASFVANQRGAADAEPNVNVSAHAAPAIQPGKGHQDTNAQTTLGHKDARMNSVYTDTRGTEWKILGILEHYVVRQWVRESAIYWPCIWLHSAVTPAGAPWDARV